MAGRLPSPATLLVMFLALMILFPATKSFLVDLCYSIERKRDAWISVFGFYVFCALIGSFIDSGSGFALGIAMAGLVRLLFLFFGSLLFIRPSAPPIAQFAIVSIVAILYGWAYIMLPPSLDPVPPLPSIAQPVFYWVIASAFAMITVELLWSFQNGIKLQQGVFQYSITEQLKMLQNNTEGRRACVVLINLLRWQSVGLEVDRLEKLVPPGLNVSRLVRLLEIHQQVICGTHSVLKHPFYPLEEQRLLVEEIFGITITNQELENALRTVLHSFTNDAELASTELWSIPSFQELISHIDDPRSKPARASIMRNIIKAKMDELNDPSSGRENADDFEVLRHIAFLENTNEKAMDELFISPATFYRREKRAIKRLLNKLIKDNLSLTAENTFS